MKGCVTGRDTHRQRQRPALNEKAKVYCADKTGQQDEPCSETAMLHTTRTPEENQIQESPPKNIVQLELMETPQSAAVVHKKPTKKPGLSS